MALSNDEQTRYNEDGFLILPGILDGAIRAPYMAVFNELVERAKRMEKPEGAFSLAPDAEGRPIAGRLHKVQGVCVEDARILGLAAEPAILDRVETLIGPNIDMFGSKFFPMMTAGATSTGWHQDNHYFGTNTSRVVSCAIYLEETDRDNGCLMVLPGSHKTGELVRHESGGGVYAHGQWADVDETKAIDVVCPPGTVVLFSANLLHGARANVSGRSSFRTAWHYIPGDLQLELFPRGGYRDRHLVRGE
jgi:ectoine hydroxylase-related dioxygenase (phytanoyl-CoA dioxygenase family)